MGVALVMKRIIGTVEEEQGNAVLHSKRCLASCTLLTRQSASVLKVSVPCGLRRL